MKIFGTGWQRTGTTSLAAALELLEVSTRDFPWELLDDPEHPVLDRFDAFVDNPVPLLYRDLDRRRPGSRFVHTVRDEDSWLESVEWLFRIGRLRYGWERNPIFDRMHRALYGTTRFDARRFLERYRRHDREVREHFASRPDDLLVLDLTRGEGFPEICRFLELEVPDAAMPHRNARASWLGVRLERLRQRLRVIAGQGPDC